MPVGRYEKAMAILGQPVVKRPGFDEGLIPAYSGKTEYKAEIDRILTRISGDLVRLMSDLAHVKELMGRL